MGFVTLGLIVALFVVVWLFDRRARRHGHRFRSASDIRRSELDVRRNARAARETFANPIDPDWAKPDDRR